MQLTPVKLSEARDFVKNFHRHNKAPVGGYWAIGASHAGHLVGVIIVGRAIARFLDEPLTAEVTRCCVIDSAPKGTCSFLYAAAWRAWRAMGGAKLITYTLQSESGASLRGAGWKVVAELSANRPDGWCNRPGRTWQPVVGQAKFRWEVVDAPTP